MPRLSLYRTEKQNDYKYLDKIIDEQFTTGGTDLFIHKYVGPKDQGTSTDYTQPQYAEQSETNIQDLLFMENRDRKYETSIYRLRGHYSVQNLDFDLSQFGLFLSNDIIFITCHFNRMVDIIGRKLMVGDVLELPHLLDYYPLNEKLQYALKRFYQITDANYASEGFSQTWYPHLWRIKCEPLTDSQEFSDILNAPNNDDNYLGDWNSTTTYPPGYTITFGDKTYESITDVPAGVYPPNDTYWKEVTGDSIKDSSSTYTTNIMINDALLAEARQNVPLSGYDNTMLYVVPTTGPYDSLGNAVINEGEPALPVGVNVFSGNTTAAIEFNNNPNYTLATYGIRISPATLKSLQDQTEFGNPLDHIMTASMQLISQAPIQSNSGSGPVEPSVSLLITPSPITFPYGSADNTYATADQNPEAPGFNNDTAYMSFTSDYDPRYRFIARSTPRSFGYAAGYLTGDGKAPNGLPTGAGISFPSNPNLGDYFLRTDYLPQLLFRWDGRSWVRISKNVRTGLDFDITNQSLLSGFINNENTIYSNNDKKNIPEAQDLVSILKPKPDNLPPIT